MSTCSRRREHNLFTVVNGNDNTVLFCCLLTLSM